jgi:hypothetical protein
LKIGKTLFKNQFIGVYPADKIPKNDGYQIINLDNEGLPGSHWVGIFNKLGKQYVYDSFGRPTTEILPLMHKEATDADYDPEQLSTQDDCGARSMAWLLLVKHWGIELALLV